MKAGAARGSRTAVVLFVAACLAYLPGVTWGLPEAIDAERVNTWAPDDIAPLAPLAETFNTFVRASPDRLLRYPLFHHFLLTLAYAPVLLWLVLAGRFRQPGGVFPFGFTDPVAAFRLLTLIARLVSIAMAAGVGVAAYRIASMLWDRRTAIVAAVASLSVYPMVYYAKTGNLDVPVLFWTSLGLVVYVRMLVDAVTIRRAAALGAFAALSAATKDQGAAAFLLLPLVLVPLHWRAVGRGETTTWGPPAALLVAGLGVYAVASGLVFDPERYLAHLRFLADPDVRNRPFASFVTWHPLGAAGVAALMSDVARSQYWFLGPVALTMAAIGFGASVTERPIAAALVVPAVSHGLTFLVPIQYFYVRFAMPIAFVVGIFAARGVTTVIDQIARARRRGRPQKGSVAQDFSPGGVLSALVIVGTLAWPVVLSGDLTRQMIRDSRVEAAQWLAARLTKGQRVAHFGTARILPHLPASVATLALPPGTEAFATLARERPEVVAILPDWTSPAGVDYSARCPVEVYLALSQGTIGYRLARRFQAPALITRRLLDYPSVNPPVQIFLRADLWRDAEPSPR